MKRLIWLPVAGFLLIVGAAAAAAAPEVVQTATGAIEAATSPAPSGATANESDHPLVLGGPGELLDEVLSSLVDDGTLTQAQSDAITDALKAKVEERRAELQRLREAWQQARQQIREFLADGVITTEEINQLPEDNPLRQAWNGIAGDGELTLDQLREFGPFGGHGFGGRFHHGPPEWLLPDDTAEETGG